MSLAESNVTPPECGDVTLIARSAIGGGDGLARKSKAGKGGEPPATTALLKRRRRLALASAYLLLFALLGALSLAYPAGWMPGPLSDEHAFTGDRCDTCHSPWGDVESRCANCHEGATLEKPWHEHRQAEIPREAAAPLSGGPLSKTFGAGGLTALSLVAAGSVLAAALVQGRISPRTRLLDWRRER
jgi:hypothetical protein